MLILGWHGSPRIREFEDIADPYHHDGSAVLIRDGVVIAAIEEERLNRVKHSSFFPARSIRFCLDKIGAKINDLDAIATDLSEDYYDFALLRESALDPRYLRQTTKELITNTFAKEFCVDVSHKLRFCKHHIAHLYSAWYPSGFSDTLVVALDGGGDGASGLVARCAGGKYEVYRNLPETLSLGNFYLRQIAFLGYQLFDEYKVMGLAPYGNPKTFDKLFQGLYQLQTEGRFSLVPELERLFLMNSSGFIKHARRKGDPFTQEHKDFAAALQSTLERMAEHLIYHFQTTSKERRLCLSGGVALNCTLNGRLLRSGKFTDIYVQPASHDAGNALGAAFAVAHEAGEPMRPNAMPHVFLGSFIGTKQEIERRLRSWEPLVIIEAVDDPSKIAAEMLAEGQVIAWVQGCSEFGPRALGNRSILADPRPEANKSIINSMVKKREGYRPFAPSVPEERLGQYFEAPEGVNSLPFMNVVLYVRPEMRKILGAITHVDGSARIQTVSRESNPSYHSLIEAFGEITGVAVVLNTSFNNNAEPIVDSVDDAVASFLTTGIHAMVVGGWRVKKIDEQALSSGLIELEPVLWPSRKLVRRTLVDGTVIAAIESTAGRFFEKPVSQISSELSDLLSSLKAGISVRAHLARMGIVETEAVAQLLAEMFILWKERALNFRPLSS